MKRKRPLSTSRTRMSSPRKTTMLRMLLSVDINRHDQIIDDGHPARFSMHDSSSCRLLVNRPSTLSLWVCILHGYHVGSMAADIDILKLSAKSSIATVSTSTYLNVMVLYYSVSLFSVSAAWDFITSLEHICGDIYQGGCFLMLNVILSFFLILLFKYYFKLPSSNTIVSIGF